MIIFNKTTSNHYRNISTDPPETGRGSLGNRRAHLGTAQCVWEQLNYGAARPFHLVTKNEWICDPNIHCIITLSQKPESDASLHMKLVSCLSEEPTAAVPDTYEVQPDYTPPRGGNWISDTISPDRVSLYMHSDPWLSLSRPPH